MNITVYLGANEGREPALKTAVCELGTWIGEHGHTLVYGGAQGGLMGIVADAVLEHGGLVTGVLPAVESIQKRRHPGLTAYIETKDMAERKAKMIELSDAYVALPGGPGTLDEITDVISLARLGIEDKPCVLFDIDGFYQPLKTVFDQMLEVGFAEKGDFRKVLISEDLGKIGVFLEK